MDYLYYILVTLAIMALCLYLTGFPGLKRIDSDQAAFDERARKRRKREQSQSPRHDRIPEREEMFLNRGVQNVPTPWGWPGHDDKTGIGHSVHSASIPKTPEVHGVSDSLHRWVDRLVSEKRTVDDQDYVLKKEASVRALLEDRYGRTLRTPVKPDREGKPLQLREPGGLNDQMDSYLNGRGDKVISKLESQPGQLPGSRVSGKSRSRLKEVKTPWGW